MIVHSLRLKNIKCYGEGPDGHGITVSFQPGANCVAGRNGAGKTTLIEALGYALFLAEPDFEERFNLGTYFLRAGRNTGEIDVTFTHAGQTYRVEKTIGGAAGRRRNKVVQVSDGSTCALDDAEVSAFLCRLLGFEHPAQLAEIFAKLVGVKQGRLTWPFDSKPTAAKDFFEPLLDVAIFRESAARLAEAQRHFDSLTADQKVRLATFEERIRDRADSPVKVQALTERAGQQRQAAERAHQTKAAADADRRLHEQKQAALAAARSALDTAANALSLAGQQRGALQQRVDESQTAATTVQAAQPGYDAFLKAEASLRSLQQQQNLKSELQRQRSECVQAQTEAAGRADAARRQAADALSQKEARLAQAQALRRQIDAGQQDLAATRDDFTRLTQAAAAARGACQTLQTWSASLQRAAAEHTSALAGLVRDWERIRAWNPQTLAQARAEEERLALAAKDSMRQAAKAEEVCQSLATQLRQIQNGICPFLKEQCRQFDPRAIQLDLGQKERERQDLQLRQKEAAAAHAQARSRSEQAAQQQAAAATLHAALVAKLNRWLEEPAGWQSAFLAAPFDALALYLAVPNSTLRLQPPPPLKPESCWRQSALDLALLEQADAACQTFARAATDAVTDAAHALETKLADVDRQRLQRLRQEHDLQHLKKNLEQAEADAAQLDRKLACLDQESAQAGAQAAAAARRRQELEGRLHPLANLDQTVQEQQAAKDLHGEHHRRFLGAKPLADQLAARRTALEQAVQREHAARAARQLRAEQFELANRQFDPAALEAARAADALAGTRLAMAEQAQQQADRDLRAEQDRFRQFQEACSGKAQIDRELHRLQAAAELAKCAGRILKATAPAVAQHLCSRIALQAQRLFNEIHHDPIELEWNAEPCYSLRIGPGDRRFAMLSGGEQTKLALAMTLAMIREFSSLRFAVFDEPTYAVDADSRARLADAILAAEKAAGLEQLILVSHDDAFEGYLENVILLRKLAGVGTEPAGSTAPGGAPPAPTP